ncbi:uncharacterized protein LOC126801096 [Argentina anserina]|uniref:uncharacterized protein LOC126801096 n=1 Tax=Argentina anserina TaxID=57926 RepID=UPI0021765917|nr:uncharacterized protein LOC126801096 [Potentilla anserina]
MDTENINTANPPQGSTVVQNITNYPTKIIRENKIKLLKGLAHTGKLGEKISQTFIPTEPKWGQSVSERGVYIDLDQVGNKRKVIDNWVASLRLKQVLVIYAQFCGDITGYSEQPKERAKANIQKLSICNMRYFEEYTNEFQNYYCTIRDIDNEDLVRTYYEKLQEPWNDVVAQSIEENPLSFFTVGGIAEKVRDLLRRQCVENRKSKTVKKHVSQDIRDSYVVGMSHGKKIQNKSSLTTKMERKKKFLKKEVEFLKKLQKKI